MKKLFTLFVSLWMAIASLFAANISANTVIYFDASAYTNIQTSIASGKTLQMLLGHSSWSQGYKMTAVDGYDNIYSVKMPKWDGCTQLAFCTVDSEWGGEGSSVTSRLNWTYEKTAVHSISSNMSGNVGFAGNPLTRTNNYTLPVKAPKITVAAAPEFATTTVGETSNATLKYTLENATEATATIEGEGFSISAQEVGSVTIAFAPEAEGDYTGTLTITSGEVKETVALAAKAVAAEAPKVPEFLNVTTPVFAEIIEGEVTTAEVTYELVNATEATASVDGEFFSIKEQELGKVIIEFASEEAGVFEGTLTLTSGETVKEITFTATAKKAPVVITISFVNPDWTEAAFYAWGADGLPSTWPGEAMTKGENGKFTYDLTLPENGTYNFIINNNNKGTQSVDMAGVTESTCYNLGAKSGEKYTLVVAENCDYTPAPEPEPIDPYVAIRGTMTDWVMENDIKMTYNAEAANGPEWYITAFEVPADGKFKVVSVDAKSLATWYGSDKVDLQEGITNAGQGDGDIALPAGKYDIYFKVNEGRMWIQKYVEPTPEPDPVPALTVSAEAVTFDELTLGEEPVSATETITYTIENSEEAVVLALESDVFTAEDAEGTITITFAPTSEGEYTAELTLTLGDIVKTVAISGAAKAAAVEPEKPKIIITSELPEFPVTVIGETSEAIITYEVENTDAEVSVLIQGEGFSGEDVDGTITIIFTPTEEKVYSGAVTITAGEISQDVVLFAQAVAEEEPEPDNTITFTVQVPEGTKECWIAGTPGWAFIQMEEVEDEENLFTVTVENTVLDGAQWKYASGKDWQYAEVIEGNGNRTEAEDPYDVVTAWQKLYDPDFQPIDPYYAIRGLNGDASWTGSGDIKLEESADGSEWFALGFTVAEGESFKVIYIDENADVSGWYAGIEEECKVGQTFDKDGNVVLPAGTYDLYFKSVSKLMWISKVDTPTDVEDAVAELIYAVDGTIIAPAPFAIIDLAGKDVTNANGSLQGTYIVKTQNSTAKISVK